MTESTRHQFNIKKRRLFKVLTLVVLPIIVLVTSELCLYLFGFGITYEQEDPFLGFKTENSLFEEIQSDDPPKGAMYVTRRSKLTWFNHQEFEVTKPVNCYRVFCFGGSTTFGRPYSYETAFPNWLQVILQSSDRSTLIEVINVGGVSYASYRIVNLMKEMVNYEPDLFIVYSGHNEFLEERTYSDILQESPSVTQLRALFNRLRTYSFLRSIWVGFQEREGHAGKQKFQMTGEVSAILDQSFGLEHYHRDSVKEKSILNHFRLNLERVYEIAEKDNVDLLFVVPPSNEKDFSPFKSEFYEQLSPDRKRSWYRLYDDGRSKLSHQDYRGALDSFKEAAKIDSGHADLRYRAGQCLFAMGRYLAAKHEFVRAGELDVAPLRSTATVQQIVRDVGRNRAISIIDLVAILESESRRLSGHSILGREFFFDHAHPTVEIHQLLAEELAKALLEDGLVVPTRSWHQVNRTALYDSVWATIDSVYYALRDLNLAKVLDWAGKKEEAAPFILRAAEALPNHPEAHYFLGKMYQEHGELSRARLAYRTVLRLDSTNAKSYNALGVLHERINRLDEAVSHFSSAIHYDPEYDHAYYNLGRVFYKQGRTEDATQAYQQAVTLNPHHSKALNDLGVMFMTQGNLEGASRAFEETLELEPQNLRAYNYLGLVYFQQANLERARAMFHAALELNPNDDFARQWLNHVKHHID